MAASRITASSLRVIRRGLALVPLIALAACRTEPAALKQDREIDNRNGALERIRTAYADSVHRQAKQARFAPKPLALPSPSLPGAPETPQVGTVASIAPAIIAKPDAAAKAKTTLIAFNHAPFPYDGTIGPSDQPFYNIAGDGRRGHRTAYNRVYWEDETYSDPRVLLHIPRGFDTSRPAVMVLYFHGHGATLERDVHRRQQLPRQISESGINAVLVAPQLAVDARDSSPGKLWEPEGVKRFMAEAANKLAKLHGEPNSRRIFAAMPVVIVAYSGGYLPAAWTISGGGFGKRLRGVVLLDALYGATDKFADWIARQRSGFFVSAYANSTRTRNRAFEKSLSERDIPMRSELGDRLERGSVVFLATAPDTDHRDFVTQAWTRYPVKDLLQRMTMADRTY